MASIRSIARRLPRFTVRRLMVAVVGLAVSMNGVRCIRENFATRYAPGFSEVQFRKVRVGMTRDQVARLMGDPLRKDSTSSRWAPYENWIYSDPPPPATIGANYWRRWIIFDGDVVREVLDDFYADRSRPGRGRAGSVGDRLGVR